MSFAELLLLGVALSMDAFTVSVTNGMTLGSVPLRYALAVSLTFGTFQARRCGNCVQQNVKTRTAKRLSPL